MGLPPLIESKNLVFKLRSVNSIVIAPASTGNDKTNKNTVIKILQMYKYTFSKFIIRIFNMVTIKLIDPKIEEIPAICKEKIPKSTEALLCPVKEANGG